MLPFTRKIRCIPHWHVAVQEKYSVLHSVGFHHISWDRAVTCAVSVNTRAPIL